MPNRNEDKMEEALQEEIVAPLEPETVESYSNKNLTHRQSGVICPHCKGSAFSTSDRKYDTCKCGQTRITGGTKYMSYRTDAPYDISDVRVIAVYQTPEIEEEEVEVGPPVPTLEEIKEELNVIVDDTPQVNNDQP